MSVSGDPGDAYMGDSDDDLPLEGSIQFALDLNKGANWLCGLTNAEIANLHAYDKADIVQSLARLLGVAEAAGVLGWRDAELDSKLCEVSLGYFPNPSTLDPGDVTMHDAPPRAPCGGVPHRRAAPPLGARPLPCPPPGERGG